MFFILFILCVSIIFLFLCPIVKRKKLTSFLLIGILLVSQFINVNASIYVSDEEAAQALPYIYTFNNHNISDEASRDMIKDNPNLVKSIYYAYGSIGFCKNYTVFENFYLENQCTTEENKLYLMNQILSNIYLNADNDVALSYTSIIKDLPDPDSTFHAFYLKDSDSELIGFSYCMDEPDENTVDAEVHEEEEPVSISQSEEDMDILGTSNGIYYNGHPAIGSFTEIKGTDYGFPGNSIPANWKNATLNNQIEIAKVKFSYTYVGNSSSTEATFGGANATITNIISGPYASNKLINKNISLFHCMTGNTDSAPYAKNDSDADSNLYIANNADNVCYMHFYVRSVDTNKHKVFIEIRTDYIDADYNRHNTSVQAVAGGVWYTYNPESYASIQKAGIHQYMDNDIIANDDNLHHFSLNGIKYGIYSMNNKNTPIATITFDAEGVPNPQIVKLEANTEYYYHEICGNQYYRTDPEFYKFNSGEYKTNSIEASLHLNVTDSIKPYSLYFQKKANNNTLTENNSMYSLAGASYSLFDKKNQYANFIVGYESMDAGNQYQIPIIYNTGETPFLTDKNGNLTFTFNYTGNSSNITNYYKYVIQDGATYTITFTEDSPLQLFYGEYYIKETNSPKGFMIDSGCSKTGHKIITNNGEAVTKVTCCDNPFFHILKLNIHKNDFENNNNIPLGNSTLEGAVFEICYYDGLFEKDELKSVSPRKTWYLGTDKNGNLDFQTGLCPPQYTSDSFYMDNGKRVIPLGTVTIQEVQAPEGYLNVNDENQSGKIIIYDKVYPDNEMILLHIQNNTSKTGTDVYVDNAKTDTSNLDINVFDHVKRGDLSFVKTNYKNGKPMKNIAFLLTSNTTGEQHILVTDDNGYATTKSHSSQWINGEKTMQLHSKDTNINDIYIDDLKNTNILNNTISPSGIWFFGTSDKSKWDIGTIDDNHGALPYDSYTITEIYSYGNETTQLLIDNDFKFNMENDGECITLSISDMPTPVISTTSYDNKFKDHYSLPEKNTTIIDVVSYNYLRFNKEYTFKGILVAREDCTTKDGHSYHAGDPILDAQGNYIRNNISFKTEPKGDSAYYANAYGSVNLIYNFDASNLQGINAVWQTFLCEGVDTAFIEVENGKIQKSKSNIMYYEIRNDQKQYIEDTGLNNVKEFVSFMSIDTDAWTSNYKINIDKPSPDTVITDTVYLSNLIENNEYKIRTTLVDGESGSVIYGTDGNPCTVLTNNIIYKENPATKSMKIDIELPAFDSSSYLGRHVVVFEELLWNNQVYVKDTDLYNERESVYFPYIMKTTATDSNGSKTVPLKDKITIVDTVAYAGLAPNHEYTMKGTLHYKDKNGNDKTLSDLQNKPFEANITFIPDSCNGEVKVTFEIDLNDVKLDNNDIFPSEIVVFEELLYNDISIYMHADINDENQTLSFPALETSLVNPTSELQFLETYNKGITITDHVKYTNLNAGETYTLIGKLINTKTGKPLEENGKEVVGTTTFEAESDSGIVDVNFRFNGNNIPELFNEETKQADAQIVAYEYLYSKFDYSNAVAKHTSSNYTDIYDNVKLWSVHANPDNRDQTITKVEGTTSLCNRNNGEQYIFRNATIDIEDTVEYKNLLIGKKYMAAGTLYDSKTGKPIKDRNNNIIKSIVQFVPEEKNGSIKVQFSLNYDDILDIDKVDSITAFEELIDTDTNQIIFQHKDLNDIHQTVYFLDVETEALCTDTNTHTGKISDDVQIIDTIHYRNLIIGREYTVKGKLYEKSSNQPLLCDGKEVTSELTFIAEDRNGTIPVSFNFNASNLANKEIVVFEEIYSNQHLIGSHSDINDEKQTIIFPPENNPPKKTGDHIGLYYTLFTLLTMSLILSMIIYCNMRKRELSVYFRRLYDRIHKS